MADGETENSEETDAHTPQPSYTQEKSPVTPPLDNSSNHLSTPWHRLALIVATS